MLQALKKFIAELSQDSEPKPIGEDDNRLAAAALLVHAATIDGHVSDLEGDKLHGLVKRRFDLTNAEADELLAAATAAEHEAVDLYGFTSRLLRSLDEEGRRKIVEMMWEVAYADGQVSEFEDNLIWRVADLLAVSSRERVLLRRQVAQTRGEGE